MTAPSATTRSRGVEPLPALQRNGQAAVARLFQVANVTDAEAPAARNQEIGVGPVEPGVASPRQQVQGLAHQFRYIAREGKVEARSISPALPKLVSSPAAPCRSISATSRPRA